MVAAIEVERVSKRFDRPVLQHLSLTVFSGEIYGLLGPNGAGKSTLLHLLLGFLRPDGGSLRVLGARDPATVIGRVGYLPERLRYHLRFTAREYLTHLGALSDLRGLRLRQRVQEELQAVGLADTADRQLGTLSKGTLQRVGVAQALLAHPELLLIDEPNSGLDPAGQQEQLALLRSLRARGLTILMATHSLLEAEAICDRVGVLARGQIAAEAEVAALQRPGGSAAIRLAALPDELALRLMRVSAAVHCEGQTVRLAPNTPQLQAEVLRLLLQADAPIIALEPLARPLDELYTRAVRGEPQLALPAPPPLNAEFAPPDHPDRLAITRQRRKSITQPLPELTEAPPQPDEEPHP